MLIASPVLAQDDDPGFLTRFLQDNLSSAGRTVQISGPDAAAFTQASVLPASSTPLQRERSHEPRLSAACWSPAIRRRAVSSRALQPGRRPC